MSAPGLIKVTKLNPAAYKKLPQLSLRYGTAPTKFGNCLAAFGGGKLCYLSFYDSEPPFDDLKKVWSKASLDEDNGLVSAKVVKLFDGNNNDLEIYLKGTDFEMEVWEALLGVRKGTTASYADVAAGIGKPNAVRAVARAIAKNNVGYFVPCHRVIRKDGKVHKYRSGAHRKVQMLQDEGAI